MNFYDRGFDFYKTAPELMLVAVWWHARTLTRDFADQHEFVQGYAAARKKKDDYQKEQRQ